MNERKFDAGSLAEQIDSAKRSLDSLPEWLKDSAKFQGQNHAFDEGASSTEEVQNDLGSNEASE